MQEVEGPPAVPGVVAIGGEWSSECKKTRAGASDEGGYFLEIFAGVANLTAAVRRVNMPVLDPLDVQDATYAFLKNFDLLRNKDYRAIKKLIQCRILRWVHFVPPCATFSRGRDRDGVPPVRSIQCPDGASATR